MKKKVMIVLSVVLVITVCVIAVLLMTEKKKVNAKEPVLTDNLVSDFDTKTEATTLSGKVYANSSQKIKLADNREVENVLVKEGDSVEVGQDLFTYKDLEGENSLKEAELIVAEKQKLLENSQSTSNMEWSIYNAMKKQADVDKTELYQQQMKAQMATNEINSAELSLEVAQSTYNSTKQKFDERIVKSKVKGTVKVIDNDKLQPSTNDAGNFMELLDESTLFVKGEISEFDIDTMTLGQRVAIIDRKNPKNTWEGQVTKLAHMASEDNQEADSKETENPNLSKYPFTIKLNPAETYPIIGSHVYAQLLEEEDSTIVKVPSAYIITENGGKDDKSVHKYIWKSVDKKILKQEVKINETQSDSKIVSVKEGLSKKDKVVLPQPELKEGMEIGKPINSD